MAYIFLCAFLMVSTWRFWSAKNVDFRSRKAARVLVLIAITMAAIWYFHRYVLFIMTLTYMLTGVVFRLTYAFRKRSPVPPVIPPEEVPGH